MSRLRWKWIGYHVYSNLLTSGTLVAFYFVFREVPRDSNLFVVQYALAALVTSILLGFVCGVNFSRNIRNRFEEVTVGAKNLAFGNLNYRLAFSDDKEIGEIATAFNDMAAQLEQQVVALQKLAAENQDLITKTKTAAVTEERQRLARDLHDAVSQQLFAISVTAATAERLLKRDPEKCEELISHIEESSTKAQAEMRALLLQLRPPTLEHESLGEAIKSLSAELESKQSIAFELELQEIPLPETIENQLYRVVQEGLSNVLRHAQASRVRIRLRKSGDGKRIHLTLEDNGQGFSQERTTKTSYGLESIRERITQLGGNVDWITYPDEGTRMEVRIPIMSEEG